MPKSSLPRTSPESQGLSSSAVNAFLDAIDARDDLELHSLMILRHGNVLAEGWWRPYGPDQLHLLYSLSKSFTSAAAGMAAAEGLLSLDDRVADLFAEHADVITDDRVRELTLRHLLRMATGHREDALPRAFAASPDDLVRGFLSVPLDQDPGSLFCYNNAATFVVGAAVQKRSGQSLVDFLTPRLFGPLGMDRLYWQTDSQGRNLGFTGLHLTTESIARFGQTVIQGGQWQGQQLLDPAWLEQATREQTDNSGHDGGLDWTQGYGYQFWMSRHGFRGDGAYGQFCVVLPEQDALVITTSATNDMQGILDAVWNHLLPGFADTPPLSDDGGPDDGGPDDAGPDPAESARLSERLAGLSLPPVGSSGWSDPPVPAPVDAAAEPIAGSANPLLVTDIRTSAGEITVSLDHHQQPVESPRTMSRSLPSLLILRCRIGAWSSETIRSAGIELPYAGSATIAEDGTLEAEVAFIQTPHRLRIHRAADGTVRTGWYAVPLSPPYPELLATRPVEL